MIDNHSHSQSQWRRSRSGGFPKTMYVCICNGVTDSDIRQAAKAGCGGLAELTMRTGCGACCGSCVDTAAEMLEQARAEQKPARDNVVEFPRISRSEEHTSELQSLMRISYAVFCLKKNKTKNQQYYSYKNT